jgi:hypothetical protein
MSQKRQFFRYFFNENILKIIASVPGVMFCTPVWSKLFSLYEVGVKFNTWLQNLIPLNDYWVLNVWEEINLSVHFSLNFKPGLPDGIF